MSKDITTVRYLGVEEPVEPAAPSVPPNFTYIDWMKESTIWHSGAAARKWSVLALMAVLVGYATVFINVASAGLNDLKMGLCLSKLEKWSLLSPYLTCPADNWYDWLSIVFHRTGFWLAVLFNFPLYLAFLCIFTATAGYLKHTRAPLVKQSGIPEIKLIVAGLNYHLDTYLGATALVAKVGALVLVVGSGFWLGKEGPLVHIACCILTVCFKYGWGTTVAEGLRREMLTAATATGIAVAFDSPIGGVLFVAELLPSYFIPTKIMWNSFVCATLALIALTGSKVFTDGEGFHEQQLFQVLFGNFSWLFAETVPFVFLGILGGFYGHAFTSVYMKFSNPNYKHRIWNRLSAILGVKESNAHYAELLALAVVTAILTFLLPMTRMPLASFLKQLYTACPEVPLSDEGHASNFLCQSSSGSTVFQLAFIIVEGFLLSTYSYSVALPGGVLMPSLVLGAASGRLVGLVSEVVQNHIGSELWSTCTAKSCSVSPSSYAVVGSAAFMTGITKLSLSVVVIVFELTGAVTYVLPIMVAVMTAKFVNDWLCDSNIYDAWLENEFNLSEDIGKLNANKGSGLCEFSTKTTEFRSHLPDVTIAAVMAPLDQTRHLVVFPAHPYSLSALYAFMSEDSHEGYPLVASDEVPVSLGYITKSELYVLLQNAFGNLQSSAELFCFRVEVPDALKQQQYEFEQNLGRSYTGAHIIPIAVQTSTIVAKVNAPLSQIIELFEFMHLNYLILTDADANGTMAGFVDRFMIAQTLRHKFANIDYDPHVPSEFDIGDDEFISERPAPQRRYNTVPLIT